MTVESQISNDCLYANVKNRYQQTKNYDEILRKSGYIYENRTKIDEKAIKDLDLLTLPIKKFEYDENKKYAVIVTTGSFSPIHPGHIKALKISKDYVETLGYECIQGIISLSHDEYVSKKNGGIAKMDVGLRTNLVYEAIKNEDWLTVDRFEGELVSCPINFSTVLARVYHYFIYHTNLKPEQLEVFYVFGSDNVNFSYAFIDNTQYHSVCVKRDGSSYVKTHENLSHEKNIHFLENDCEDSASLSSTEFRKRKIEILKPLKTKKQVYLIRTDDADISVAYKLKELIIKYVNKDVDIRLFNSDDIKQNITNTISLDKYISGDYNLDISRLFEISGHQISPIKMKCLSAELELQMKNIPAGQYTLIDDDSVSGYTMRAVEDLLKPYQIEIIQKIPLVNKLLAEDEEIYDIMDARDYSFFSQNGGLVVDVFGKDSFRVPYIFPFVNLTNRSNVLADKQIEFSMEIIYENIKLIPENNYKMKLIDYLKYEDVKSFLKSYFEYFNNYLDSKYYGGINKSQ